MTRDSDFKNLVRQRMEATGQTYTAARADLLADQYPSRTDNGEHQATPRRQDFPDPDDTAWERARREQERVVGRFVRDGRMVQVPMRRKARAAVLLHLVALFEPGRTYPEPEVNAILDVVHDDHAFWRRELVDYGYLTREGGIYRLAAAAPERPRHLEQEFGDWERLWLPRFLTGRSAGRA